MRLPTIEEIDKELEKRKLEKSYFEFFKKAVQKLEPETEWKFNWHIELVCDKLQEHVERVIRGQESEFEGLIVNIPPRSSKSMIFSVCLTAWAWIHAPHLRIAGNSYNQELSIDHTVKARDLILSPFYQDFWSENYQLKKDQNQKTEFSNNFGGVRKSGANTGRHFDIIIVDDILNPTLANSEVEREKANDFFFKTIPSRFRKLSKGLKVVVMQRLHESDVCGKIEEKGLNYEKIVIPAKYDDEILQPLSLASNYIEDLFWADEFTEKYLETKKKELGPLEFGGQFQQTPYPADGSIFKKEWFSLRFNPESIHELIPMNFVSDTSYGMDEVEAQKKNRNPDKSVTLAFKVWQGNIYIYKMWLVTHGFFEFVNEYPIWVKQNGYTSNSYCYFEPKATGKSAVQHLRKSTDLNVLEDFNPRDSKEVRARNISVPKLASSRVFFNYGEDWEELISQHIKFPNGKFKDIVDTVTMAIHKIEYLPSFTIEDD